MAEAVLVHGFFGTFWGRNCGFDNFNRELRTGRAFAYAWGSTRKNLPMALIDPIGHYRSERLLADKAATLLGLQKVIELYSPSVILGHSLGGRMLFHYANMGLNLSSVQRVVTVLPDIDIDTRITTPIIQERLGDGSLKWINYYAVHDPLLWASLFLNNFVVPGGLAPIQQDGIDNRAYIPPFPQEPHTYSIKDPFFNRVAFSPMKTD